MLNKNKNKNFPRNYSDITLYFYVKIIKILI